MSDAYKDLSQQDAVKLVQERDTEILAQKKELKTSNRLFWFMFALANLSTAFSIVGRNVGEAYNERRIFGENTSLTGKVLRWKFLKACHTCNSMDEVLAAGDDKPELKALGDALRLISKDPIGKMMVEQVRARGILFDGNPENFRDNCSAGAAYNTHYGIVNYSVGTHEGALQTNALSVFMAHEMTHALQKLETGFFQAGLNGNKKDDIIHNRVFEAAAFVLGEFIDERRRWAERNPGKALPEVDDTAITRLKEKMRAFLGGNNWLVTRQQYLLEKDLNTEEYTSQPEEITLADLIRVSRLPDGRSFYPEDMTPAHIDLQVRKDYYNHFQQMKPRGIIEKAVERKTTKEKSIAENEKSAPQQSKDFFCERRLKSLDKKPVQAANP